jgi:hypothetical protein
MKKLSKILAIVAICLAPFAASTGVGATSTCQIGYTGPDSNNMCISKVEQVCTVVNSNTVTINNSNDQLAISGSGLDTGNTTAGSSTSGSATNSTGATFSVTVTNNSNGDGGINKVCVAQVSVPATPVVTPITPTTPAVTTTKATPKVLPNTSSNTLSNYIVVLAVTLGIGAVTSFLFAKVYSRR